MSDDVDDVQDPMYHMWALGHSFNLHMNEPSDILLTCTGVGGKHLNQVCNVWRYWWHSRSEISHETLDIFFILLIPGNGMCTGGFAWTWMALRARNASPSGRATFNPQSTCHGPRPGPKLAHGVRACSLCATETRARGKTRGRKRKNCRRVKKTHLYL